MFSDVLQDISCRSLLFHSSHPWYEVTTMNPFFGKNDVDVLNTFSASPSQVRSNPACDFLEPIKKDLLENLFDNECGDTVSHRSPY